MKENNSIDVLKDGHAISFVINGGDSDKKADIQNPKETADISSLHDKSDSSVSYKNVLKNTDIQYSVNGNVVKENIIIKSKKAIEKTYSYTVSTDLSIEKIMMVALSLKMLRVITYLKYHLRLCMTMIKTRLRKLQ